MEINEIEKAIREKIAGEFLDSLTPELKEEILRSSVEKTMEEIGSSYKLKTFISGKLEDSAAIYLETYLKEPIVQQRLEEQAREAVDVCLSAVVKSIARDLERNMKSKYHNFIPTNKEE